MPCVTVTDTEPVPPVADPVVPTLPRAAVYPASQAPGACCRDSLGECPERAGPCVARALSRGPSLCMGHILSPLLCVHSVSKDPFPKPAFRLDYFSALICFLREESNFPFHMCLNQDDCAQKSPNTRYFFYIGLRSHSHFFNNLTKSKFGENSSKFVFT